MRYVFLATVISLGALTSVADAQPTPAWFNETEWDHRPAVPLPSGMVFGPAKGEYVWSADGSVLVYIPPETGDRGRGFFIGKYELRRDQLAAVAKRTSRLEGPSDKVEFKQRVMVAMDQFETSTFEAEPKPSWPASGLSIERARRYCQATGLRLPTRAEWQRAAGRRCVPVCPIRSCRGRERCETFQTLRNTRGRLDGKLVANVETLCSFGGKGDSAKLDRPILRPVDEIEAGRSPFGCLGMAGNVSELTSDTWTHRNGRVYSVTCGGDTETARSSHPQLERHVRQDKREPFVGLRVAWGPWRRGPTKEAARAQELFRRGQAASVAGKHTKAFRFYEQAAELGEARSQTLVGQLLWQGKGTPKDPKAAGRWLRKAAKQHDTRAMRLLGLYHQRGADGFPKKHKSAVHWYRRAAKAGDHLSMRMLGMCYRNGTGVKKNDKQARRWLERARDAGDKVAEKLLESPEKR